MRSLSYYSCPFISVTFFSYIPWLLYPPHLSSFHLIPYHLGRWPAQTWPSPATWFLPTPLQPMTIRCWTFLNFGLFHLCNLKIRAIPLSLYFLLSHSHWNCFFPHITTLVFQSFLVHNVLLAVLTFPSTRHPMANCVTNVCSNIPEPYTLWLCPMFNTVIAATGFLSISVMMIVEEKHEHSLPTVYH